MRLFTFFGFRLEIAGLVILQQTPQSLKEFLEFRDPFSFSPGFNRVIRAAWFPANRFNGLPFSGKVGNRWNGWKKSQPRSPGWNRV